MNLDTSTGADDEGTINVAPKSAPKRGVVKLKKPPPKIIKPGNWRDGYIDGGMFKSIHSSLSSRRPMQGLTCDQSSRRETISQEYREPRNQCPDWQPHHATTRRPTPRDLSYRPPLRRSAKSITMQALPEGYHQKCRQGTHRPMPKHQEGEGSAQEGGERGPRTRQGTGEGAGGPQG